MPGAQGGMVIAFDKLTGKEVWRSIEAKNQPGVSAPIVINAGGVRQLIIYHPEAVVALDPTTGKKYWELPFHAQDSMNPSLPVTNGKDLMISTFYNGSMMIALDQTKPAASMVWKSKSDSEIDTDVLHTVIGTSVMIGDYVYGTCSYGQLRCIRISTGERIWESQDLLQEYARWATAMMVKNGDRFFINTDRGDLVIAQLSPEGYKEISRAHLIKPTTPPGNRRKLTFISWTHPAYANRHIYMRNDNEVIAATLDANDYK
jgi:outer membrane protein assembly factor BamB